MLIIVGYDPQTCDLAPVDFGVAASRFTGAPLMIASVHGVGDDRLGERQMREDLLADAADRPLTGRADDEQTRVLRVRKPHTR